MTSLIWSFFMPFFRIDQAHMRFSRRHSRPRPELERPVHSFCSSCPHLGCPSRRETLRVRVAPFPWVLFLRFDFAGAQLLGFCFTKDVSAQHLSTPGWYRLECTQDLCRRLALSGQHVFLPISGTPGLHDRFASQLPGVPS